MTFEDRLKLFCENYRLFNKSIDWLKRSIEKLPKVIEDRITEEQMESIEVFLGRYCRAVDILINKVLRGLDYIELEDSSRMLDVVINAEKRGIVSDYNVLIEMKDLRNELAHEYIEERLIEKFQEVKERSFVLLDIAERLKEYIEKNGYCR